LNSDYVDESKDLGRGRNLSGVQTAAVYISGWTAFNWFSGRSLPLSFKEHGKTFK
jgi:hypothetical protein